MDYLRRDSKKGKNKRLRRDSNDKFIQQLIN